MWNRICWWWWWRAYYWRCRYAEQLRVLSYLSVLGFCLGFLGAAWADRNRFNAHQELSPRFCYKGDDEELQLEGTVCSKLWHKYDRSFDV
jgi:hypothetical protein